MSDQIHDEEERDLIDMSTADLRAMPLYRSAPERIGLAIGDELEDWNSEFGDCESGVTWYSEAWGDPPVKVCIGYVRADLVEHLEQCLNERTAEINELTTLRAQLSEAQEMLADAENLIADWKPHMYCEHGRIRTYECEKCSAPAAPAAQVAQAVADDVVRDYPEGWVFHSADFSMAASCPARSGRVTLVRDLAGRDWWLSLSDEDKERVPLYVYGSGSNLADAIKDAALLAAAQQQKEGK